MWGFLTADKYWMCHSTWKADLLYLPLHIWIGCRDSALPTLISLSIIKLLALIHQCIHRRPLSLQHFRSESQLGQGPRTCVLWLLVKRVVAHHSGVVLGSEHSWLLNPYCFLLGCQASNHMEISLVWLFWILVCRSLMPWWWRSQGGKWLSSLYCLQNWKQRKWEYFQQYQSWTGSKAWAWVLCHQLLSGEQKGWLQYFWEQRYLWGWAERLTSPRINRGDSSA